MQPADLDAVMQVEQQAYSFPWTRGNVLDSLAAGHPAWLLQADDVVLGYYIAMAGVDEMHLLNITVNPAWQRRGLGWRLLEHLAGLCRASGAAQLWLEVRESNGPAQALYRRWGFEAVGLRKHYYPAGQSQREHAVVMRWRVRSGQAGEQGAADALV
jgi:ribosomal-protein-alanine N-acetyltransferase